MPQTPAPPEEQAGQIANLGASAEQLMSGDTPEGEHLRQALTILTDLGIQAVARVRHGLVIDEILAEIHEGNHDLVIVGTRSAEGWMRFLVNDLGQQIIGCTDRPIMVAKT